MSLQVSPCSDHGAIHLRAQHTFLCMVVNGQDTCLLKPHQDDGSGVHPTLATALARYAP
jgi:hypothetical protein